MTSNNDLAELKDGKIIFRQKALKWEDTTSTLKDLLAFVDFLKLPSTSTPLKEWPSEYLPLIAKLVQESDKAQLPLSKHIKKTILRRCASGSDDNQDEKALLEDDRVSLDVISQAVSKVASRTNYGIENGPLTLSIWRWEVKNPEEMLPSPTEEGACNAQTATRRQEERVQASISLRAAFDALPDDEKDVYLKKGKRKEKNGTSLVTTAEDEKTAGSSRSPPEKETGGKKKDVEKEKPSKVKPKEKKAPAKQSKAFTAFFSKAAKPTNAVVASKPVSPQSDFEKTFKPYLPKKDIRVAPSNRFVWERAVVKQTEVQSAKGKAKATHATEVIELDDDGDIVMERKPSIVDLTMEEDAPLPKSENRSDTCEAPPTKVDPTQMSTKELLDQFLSSVPPSHLSQRCSGQLLSHISNLRISGKSGRPSESPQKPNSGFKTPHHVSVRAIMNQLAEAEVLGDAKATRKLLRMLKDRRKFPAKVFVFADNNRPGYYGTWTKSSPFVGPRKPFAKDLVTFDYSYDSGEEWEEEPADAEEVTSVGDDESDSGSLEEEDEFDGWLVGDDDAEVEEESGSAGSRSLSPPTSDARKRKGPTSSATKPEGNKRRKVVPLVPFIKGPCWENTIGVCEYDTFQPFRIQLLNDSPFPLDPFTFVSEPIVAEESTKLPSSLTKENDPRLLLPTPTAVTNGTFAVPALPPHLHPSNQANLPPQASPHQSPDPALAKGRKVKLPDDPQNPAKPSKQKKSFPATYIPQMLGMVEGSTKTKAHLIEELAAFFKERGVPKYAVEPALNEVAAAVKEGTNRIWRVRNEIWAREGLTPQTIAIQASASG